MKIAINGRLLGDRLEGIGHYTVEITRRMAQEHPNDDFVIITDRQIDQELFTQKNISFYKTGIPTRHPISWYLWFEYFLPRVLSQISAQVFYSTEGMISLKTKTPTLMTIHDLAYIHFPKGSISSHRSYLNHFMKKYISRADRITCVSQFTKEDVCKQFPKAASKTSVHYNGLRSEFEPMLPQAVQKIQDEYCEGNKYILYMGALHPRKNVVRLIQAFEQYKEESGDKICLMIAGRLAWRSHEIRKAVLSSKYWDDIIHVTEFEDNLSELVGAAHCICYISLFEGFGLPVLEGMGSGVPVVTSAGSAMAEISKGAAIYVDPYSVEQIANGMKAAINDERLREALIEEGKKIAKEYSWNDTAERIYGELSALAG